MEKEKKSKLHTPEEILNALHVIQDTCEYYLHGNDEDCKKSGAGFGPEKRNGTKKSRHSTVDSFRWILGRGRIGVPAGGKTVHRALYRSVFPAGSTNVHCAVSVA